MTSVPILLYHSVTAEPAEWIAPFAIRPSTFAEHLSAVAASGRTPMTMSAYVDGLLGNAPLPDRPVIVTVDDGFADFRDNALPLLAQFGVPSTLYVTTGALAGNRQESVLPPAPMLRPEDLPDLEAAGVEIGAHSHTHRQLDLLPAREVDEELVRSRGVLAELLGHPIRSFAYPHGYWKLRVRRQVAAVGFQSACGVANAHSGAHDSLLALSRYIVRAETDAATIAGWLAIPGASRRPDRIRPFGWRVYRRLIDTRQPRSWLA